MIVKGLKRAAGIIDRELKEQETYSGSGLDLMKRLWSDYLVKRRGAIIVALSVTILGSMATLCFPLTIKFLFDRVLTPEAIKSKVLFNKHLYLAVIYLLMNIGIWSVSLLCQWIRSKIILSTGNRIVFELRRDLNATLQKVHVGYYDHMTSGRIMSRILDDVDVVRQWLTHQMIDFFSGITRLVLGLTISFFLSWKLALLIIIVIPAYAVTIRYLRPYVRRCNLTLRRFNAIMYGRAAERIGAVSVIRAFGKEKREALEFSRLIHDFVRVGNRLVFFNQGMSATAGSISALVSGAVIWLAALGVRFGSMSLGSMLAQVRVLNNMFEPVQSLATLMVQFQAFLVVVNRIFVMRDTSTDMTHNNVHLEKFERQLEFRNVSFSYIAKGRVVLDKISFSINRGERIALMGPSGSGKSTLLSLLIRFYDPTDGGIFIDGKSFRDYDPSSIRRHIRMAQQEPFVFSGSIEENILYGQMDASELEVVTAAQQAGLHDFIMGIPDNYDAKVGERGITLSGGQKQRLTLATALLTNPEILLLDDITSSLDAHTEKMINDELDKTLVGRTSIVITQRAAMARRCDRIIILENGCITAIGSHKELINQKGFYRTISTKQGWSASSVNPDPFSPDKISCAIPDEKMAIGVQQ